tara:strand:+ start:26723 stop:27601 length:879 start_codon:yes stop_codon:yes gene_type:complete
MKLCYYHDTEGNFGDDLNAWLWPRLLPGIIDGTCQVGEEYKEQNNGEKALLYGIGTILDDRIPPAPVKFIAGSGCGYFDAPKIDNSYNIYFVRGPNTAAQIGIDKELGIGDPAILLKQLIPRPEKTIHKISLIMHCDTAKSGYWKSIAEDLGIHHIDPRSSDPMTVVHALINSEYIITESLHGAIIADAFDIPWLPISTMPHINPFKWDDWCKTVRLTYQPEKLISIYEDHQANSLKKIVNSGKAKIARRQLKKLLAEQRSFNSAPQTIDSLCSQMTEKLELLKTDAQRLAD